MGTRGVVLVKPGKAVTEERREDIISTAIAATCNQAPAGTIIAAPSAIPLLVVLRLEDRMTRREVSSSELDVIHIMALLFGSGCTLIVVVSLKNLKDRYKEICPGPTPNNSRITKRKMNCFALS